MYLAKRSIDKAMDSYYYQNFRSVTDYKPSASSSKPVKLIFSYDVASLVFTKEIISRRCGGNGGNESLKVMLVDSNTGEKISTGTLAFAKVKIVLLRGDCGGTATGQEFEKNIVVNLGSKKNLLLGNLYVDLKHGCGTVGKIRIKHDRNPLKTVRFRLGAMVVDSGRYHDVKEAITKPFQVKDRRNMPKCLGPLPLEHDVWQLMNISKKGEIYKQLKNKGILTVRDFVCKLSSNATELQEISGMKGKRWEMTVNHAKASLIENVNTGSTSQQSNMLSYDDHDHSIEFGNDCYKPQPCFEAEAFGENMIIDDTFSISAYDLDVFELCQAYQGGANCALGGGICVKVKKRWAKLRMFVFLIASFTKNIRSYMCACVADVSQVS